MNEWTKGKAKNAHKYPCIQITRREFLQACFLKGVQEGQDWWVEVTWKASAQTQAGRGERSARAHRGRNRGCVRVKGDMGLSNEDEPGSQNPSLWEAWVFSTQHMNEDKSVSSWGDPSSEGSGKEGLMGWGGMKHGNLLSGVWLWQRGKDVLGITTTLHWRNKGISSPQSKT